MGYTGRGGLLATRARSCLNVGRGDVVTYHWFFGFHFFFPRRLAEGNG
jgi:hypothetical protein